MKIALIALGSRGDVQPYIALSQALQAAGHTIRLVTHESYETQATAHGVPFWPMAGNVQEVLHSPEMRELMARGNIFEINAYTAKHAQRAAMNWQRDGLAACAGMDLLVTGVGGLYLGLALAEKLAVPLLQAHLFPFTPTAVFPAPLFPVWTGKLGRTVTRLTHHLLRQIMWQSSRKVDNLMRQQLQLPQAPFTGPYHAPAAQHMPLLYGFSPAVIAPPADWGAQTHITGYWYLDEAQKWEPPADLLRFLHAGSPPVYIGFGSMVSHNLAETIALLTEATAQSQQRAIVSLDWGNLAEVALPEHLYAVGSVPHDWLFKQVTAVVHHGGAGTTGAGLRAGVPNFIVPFFGDQMFWGERVAALGVGPRPIARKKLGATRLAEALQLMQSHAEMRQRAAALGATIQAEDGLGRAVAIINNIQLPHRKQSAHRA
jgi:sterol 3beta-glucosyltransferase